MGIFHSFLNVHQMVALVKSKRCGAKRGSGEWWSKKFPQKKSMENPQKSICFHLVGIQPRSISSQKTHQPIRNRSNRSMGCHGTTSRFTSGSFKSPRQLQPCCMSLSMFSSVGLPRLGMYVNRSLQYSIY